MNKIDIYVINLKERADRYAKIKTKFNFKSINLIFIEAIKNENGAIGCFLSHKKCIQYAKTSNMDKIIVIEDDCLPIGNDFEKRLLDIFPPELDKIYIQIAKERANIYFQGLILGLIASYLLISLLTLTNPFHKATFFLAITLVTSVLYSYSCIVILLRSLFFISKEEEEE